MTGVGYEKLLPLNTMIKFVPQQEAWIIERFGKFHTTLLPVISLLNLFSNEYVKTISN